MQKRRLFDLTLMWSIAALASTASPKKDQFHEFNLNFVMNVTSLDEIDQLIKDDKTVMLFVKNNPALGGDYQRKVQAFLNDLQLKKVDDSVVLKSVDCLEFRDFCEHEDYRERKTVLESIKQFYTVSVTLDQIEYETRSAKRVVRELLSKDIHRPDTSAELEDFVGSFYTQPDKFMFVLVSRESFDTEYLKRLVILVRTASMYSFKELVWVLGDAAEFKAKTEMHGVSVRFQEQVPLYLVDDETLDPSSEDLLHRLADTGWIKLEESIQTAGDHEDEGFIEDSHRVHNVNEIIQAVNLAVFRRPVFIDSSNFLGFETFLLKNKAYLVVDSQADPEAASTVNKFIKLAKKYNREALDYRKLHFGILDLGGLRLDYVRANYVRKFGEGFFEALGDGRLLLVGPKRDSAQVTVEFTNDNLWDDAQWTPNAPTGGQRPALTYSTLSTFAENFFDNKYREVFLKSELRHLVPAERASSEHVERFHARSLAELMKSSAWDSSQMLLVCSSDDDVNCQMAVILMRFLKKTNPEVDLSFGFINESKNHIDALFKDSTLSPRFYLINKHRRYRPELFNKEFGYMSFVEWINQTLFGGQTGPKLQFNDEQQDELLLEIAAVRGDLEEVKRLVEHRRAERNHGSRSESDLQRDL